MARATILIMVGLLTATPATAQDALTDADVQRALSAGNDKKQYKNLVADCTAASGAWAAALTGDNSLQTAGYRVTFTSHYGEIASLAANAKKKYLPTPAVVDVPEELRLPALYVWVEPRDSRGGTTLEGQIEHVVIRPEDRPQQTIQPLSQEFEPVAFQNVFGAEYGRNRVLAVFPAEAARAAGTDRDLEAVIITGDAERRCNISKKDVAKLFEF